MKKAILTLSLIYCVAGFGSTASAFVLPDPTTPLPGLGIPPASLHEDFYSYSLPILAIDYDILYGGGTGPGNPFYVNSTPGAIKNGVVIATGTSSNPAVTNFPGMDDAYPTPNSSGIPTFETGTTADPNGAGEFSGDASGTWDTTLGALIGYLNRDNADSTDDSPLVFFWNNNQTKSGSAADENLYGWGRISVVDTAAVSPLSPIDFYFADNGPVFPPNPYVNPANTGNYVLSPGKVVIGPYTIDHNLGANQAAFAFYSEDLDSNLETWLGLGYDALQIDIRLAALNNGYEQLFIHHIDRIVTDIIPEPAAILLFLGGLLGLGGLKRRKA